MQNGFIESFEATLREVDLIGRLGGDEFVDLLPSGDPNEVRKIFSRLLDGLRPLLRTFDHRGRQLRSSGLIR